MNNKTTVFTGNKKQVAIIMGQYCKVKFYWNLDKQLRIRLFVTKKLFVLNQEKQFS